MYCANCGVKLGDSEKKCPLCGTSVYHPDIVRPEKKGSYPEYVPVHDEFNRSGVLFVMTFLFAIPFLLTLIIDVSMTQSVTWSGYAAGAIFLGYTVSVLPFWFRKPNTELLVAIDFICTALLLMYIDFRTSGNWFLTFALPTTAIIGITTVAVIYLLTRYRHLALYITGGAFITMGGIAVVIEALLNITFSVREKLVWSIYPLTVLVLVGVMLLVIAVSPKLRESLERKFFI